MNSSKDNQNIDISVSNSLKGGGKSTGRSGKELFDPLDIASQIEASTDSRADPFGFGFKNKKAAEVTSQEPQSKFGKFSKASQGSKGAPASAADAAADKKDVP